MNSNNGFIKFPRSLLNDPRFLGARLKYQKVLLFLISHAAYSETTHAIGTNLINLSPGQLSYSIRKLADLCNEEVKHEEDKIDRNIIDRAIAYFEKCQFVRQEVRHGK